MNFTLLSVSVAMAAWSIAVCVAGPAVQRTQPFADEAGERESQDFNEVGPAEDWKLLQRLTKTNAFDPEDTEKTRTLMKEIEEFQRIAMAVNDTATDRNEDETTTEMGDDGGAVTETDPASSDWASTWRSVGRGGDGDDRDAFERQESEDGNFEEIIRKISNDLKKLYVKIKQVMSVVKNWVNTARGQRNGFDEPYTLSGSASESDGVYVIADSLVGDIDKSNKYTVPIHED